MRALVDLRDVDLRVHNLPLAREVDCVRPVLEQDPEDLEGGVLGAVLEVEDEAELLPDVDLVGLLLLLQARFLALVELLRVLLLQSVDALAGLLRRAGGLVQEAQPQAVHLLLHALRLPVDLRALHVVDLAVVPDQLQVREELLRVLVALQVLLHGAQVHRALDLDRIVEQVLALPVDGLHERLRVGVVHELRQDLLKLVPGHWPLIFVRARDRSARAGGGERDYGEVGNGVTGNRYTGYGATG